MAYRFLAWRQLVQFAEDTRWEAVQDLMNPDMESKAWAELLTFNEWDLVLVPKLVDGMAGTAAEARPINVANGENR